MGNRLSKLVRMSALRNASLSSSKAACCSFAPENGTLPVMCVRGRAILE